MNRPLAALLDPAMKHEAVLQEVDHACRRMDRDQAVLCHGLRRLWRDKFHRGAGRSSFAAWIERRTGMKTKLIELFSWVGSKLERLPKTLNALSSGLLGYGYDPRPRTREDPVSHVGGGVPGAGEAPAAAERPPPVVE